MSDPGLLDAFRKQCRMFGPGPTLLAWKGQAGVDPEELIDIFKEEDRRAAGVPEAEWTDQEWLAVTERFPPDTPVGVAARWVAEQRANDG